MKKTILCGIAAFAAVAAPVAAQGHSADHRSDKDNGMHRGSIHNENPINTGSERRDEARSKRHAYEASDRARERANANAGLSDIAPGDHPGNKNKDHKKPKKNKSKSKKKNQD